MDRIPPRRRQLFKLAAIALPFLGLLLLELGLRLGGFGYPTAFFLKSEAEGKPVLIENQRFGWRFFPPAMARAPLAMTVPPRKAPDTLRVVVLGESAAMGDPEPAYGFARYLDVLLREAFPEQKIEVINAAMTAINSHAILPIARDCAPLQADVWVIYMGNNEVVGPFGSGTVFGPRAPSLGLIRGALFLRTLKTGQLVDAARQWWNERRGQGAVWEGMEMFLGNTLRHDDPQMEVVYAHFARNLRDILAVGKAADAKVIVCTVAANLKDCAPFGSAHRRGLTAAEQAEWESLVKEGTALAAAGRHAEALAKFQAALQLDREHAELHFRLAECQWALGQFEAARAAFDQARELDTLRFRVDARLNEIIRQAASGQTNEGVWLVDAERALADLSEHQTPGEDFFWEHVHLNFEGNYQLALRVARQIAQIAPTSAGALRPNSWLSSQAAAEKLALTDWDRSRVVSEMRQRLERPPFTAQAGHERQVERLRAQSEALKPRLTPAALKEQALAYQKALAAWPDDATLMGNYARLLEEAGDPAGALALWQKVAEKLPHFPQAWYAQGNLLHAQGKSEAALPYFERALQLQPGSAEAWNGLALCYLSLDRLDEAVARCQQALKKDPDDPDIHYNLGIILAKQRQTNAAIQHYRQALRAFPGHLNARYNLGNLLTRGGQFPEAEKEFQALLERAPDHAPARNNYGSVLMRLGRPAEAAAQFRAALRHDPDNVEARYNLASALLALRQLDEAIAELERIARDHPNLPAVQQKLEQARRIKAAGGG